MPKYSFQDDTKEKRIIKSWHINASAWISAVRNKEIKSRTEVTNQAIIDIIINDHPKLVLDVGCGEGWLCRALENDSIKTVGIDAIDTLIDAAKSSRLGTFYKCTYDEIQNTLPKNIKYDAIVCNFSLIGHQDVDTLIQTIPTLLSKKGFLYIQTLHPLYFDKTKPYKDGWQEGSWKGFNTEFTQPAPWYFRTIESWKKLFYFSQLELVALIEPKINSKSEPSSIIFKCRKSD